MAGINVNDVIEISLVGSIFGQRTLATLHYKVTVASLSDSYVTAITLLANSYRLGGVSGAATDPYVQLGPPNWTLNGVRAQRVWPTRNIFAMAPSNLPGNEQTSATASNICGVITRKTDVATRKGIGRMHTPPLPADQYSNGMLVANYLTKMNVLAVAMRDIFISPPGDPGVTMESILWSRTTPTLTPRVIQVLSQDTVRVLRRRTLRVGE